MILRTGHSKRPKRNPCVSIPLLKHTFIIYYNLNTLRLRQNGRHFPDDILKYIFVNENLWILIKISLMFVPKDPINNNPAVVQMMTWCHSGDKPLSDPMIISLQTHICVTPPQWVKPLVFSYNLCNHSVWCYLPDTLVVVTSLYLRWLTLQFYFTGNEAIMQKVMGTFEMLLTIAT